jgi:hypothetical protein
MMMTEAAQTPHYSAVLCRCCRQPIPLPAIALEMMARRSHDQSDPAGHVVNLRCRVCDKEMPYRVSEAAEFEGTPRPRVMPARGRLRSSDRARAASV